MLTLILGMGNSPAFAQEDWQTLLTERAQLKRFIPKKEQISGLSFPSDQITVYLQGKPSTKADSKELEVRVVADLKGSYQADHSSLLMNGKPVSVQKDGSFRRVFLLKNPETKIKLLEVSPWGAVSDEPIEISFPSYSKTIAQAQNLLREGGKPADKKFFASIGLSGTHMDYQESTLSRFSSWVVTLKPSVTYWLSPGTWDLGLSGYVTALPLSESESHSVRFLGVNFRGGYTLPFISKPWEVRILAGGYYTSMIVGTNAFGFSGMMGPQFFPTLRREWGNGKSALAYFKFSPVAGDLSLLSMSNREIALGAVATMGKLWNRNPLSVTLDFARIDLEIPVPEQESQTSQISSQSISFGVALGF